MDNKNILGIVVFDKNTLGCLFPFFDGVILNIIKGKILEGGANWRNGVIAIYPFEYPKIKMATKKDFEDFKVSSNYYFN
jgi:hypothetical protein